MHSTKVKLISLIFKDYSLFCTSMRLNLTGPNIKNSPITSQDIIQAHQLEHINPASKCSVCVHPV